MGSPPFLAWILNLRQILFIICSAACQALCCQIMHTFSRAKKIFGKNSLQCHLQQDIFFLLIRWGIGKPSSLKDLVPQFAKAQQVARHL